MAAPHAEFVLFSRVRYACAAAGSMTFTRATYLSMKETSLSSCARASSPYSIGSGIEPSAAPFQLSSIALCALPLNRDKTVLLNATDTVRRGAAMPGQGDFPMDWRPAQYGIGWQAPQLAQNGAEVTRISPSWSMPIARAMAADFGRRMRIMDSCARGEKRQELVRKD